MGRRSEYLHTTPKLLISLSSPRFRTTRAVALSSKELFHVFSFSAPVIRKLTPFGWMYHRTTTVPLLLHKPISRRVAHQGFRSGGVYALSTAPFTRETAASDFSSPQRLEKGWSCCQLTWTRVRCGKCLMRRRRKEPHLEPSASYGAGQPVDVPYTCLPSCRNTSWSLLSPTWAHGSRRKCSRAPQIYC